MKLLLLGVLAVTLALAQVHSASVRGEVTDRTGAVLSGAVVQLTNPDTLQVRSYVTQADGSYQFQQLSDNLTYTLRAQYHGTFSPTKSLSKFRSAQESVVNLTVPVNR